MSVAKLSSVEQGSEFYVSILYLFDVLGTFFCTCWMLDHALEITIIP